MKVEPDSDDEYKDDVHRGRRDGGRETDIG
jgi:hypothetical protein